MSLNTSKEESYQDWLANFDALLSAWYTDPANETDDIDRIYREQEANEWIELLEAYGRGEVEYNTLINWEPDYLADIGGFTDYLTGIKGAVKWERNANFIIDSCTSEAGCNESQQAWYDRWLASGSPDTKDEMWTVEEYDEWLSTQEPEPEPEPEGPQTLDELLEQIATEEQVDKSVVEGVADIISTVKGALPTDLEEASDLIKQVLGSTVLGSALEECESWTGNTTTDGGLGVPSWTKCVDVGIFGIPGLDLPLPPGMIDISITVYDIIQKGEDIGESFEDFINDPSGWLENVIDKAVDKVQEVWGDITSGLDPKSAGDLLDILNGWIGNILGGYILNQVKDATEVLDPFLYSKGCTEEGFQEPYEGYCEEAVNNNRLVQCADGSYVNTIDECPEGAFGYCADGVTQKTDAEGTNCPEYEPPYVDEGPTPEECTQQGRAHIPGNPSANPPTQSTCGDCLGGWSEVDNQCTEDDDPITNQGPTPEDCLAQKREFIAATDVADSSCGECLSSYEDINGECTERTPVECWDGSTVYDEANCPEDTRVECWDGSLVASLDQCPEQPPETIKCEDRDAQNFGEEGECVYGPIVEECNEDTATATKKVTQTIPYGTVVRPAGPQYQLIDGVCTEVITEYVQEEATEGTCQDDQADNTGQEGPCVYTCPKGTNRQGQQVSSLDECNDTKDPPEVYCDDPKSTNYDQLGECGPDCVEGWYKPTPDSPCTEVVVGPPPVVDVCEDGSLRDPETGCPEDYCPDGSLKGLNGECPEGPDVDPECNDCTCEEYALENPLECGGDPECNDCTCEEYANDPANFLECGGDPECNDCTCAEYAAANEDECGVVENPCDDPSFAEDNPLECGWVECPSGGFAPTIELCGGGGGGCPEGQEPCEALGGECTNPEDCPGEEEEEVSLGGGSSKAGLFKEFTPTLSGDPELLARQEFPITDFLMGLFTGK